MTASGGGGPVDHLALVCPFNLQVLVVVLAGPDVAAVEIVKNQRVPFVKNLMNGDYAKEARLVPLASPAGAGGAAEAHFGVFLADT